MSAPAPGPAPAQEPAAMPGPAATSAPPAPRADTTLVAALRADLSAAGFSHDHLAGLLGEEVLSALDRDQFVPGQLRVQELLDAAAADSLPAEPAAVLSGLWLFGMEITVAQVEQALPRTGIQGLLRLELVQAQAHDDGELCRPSVDLRPYQAEQQDGVADLWVASDLSSHQLQGALPAEHVLGIGRASLTLAASIHRRPVSTALEIGTGCGIQLMHLLNHAEHVVATDLSARALDFTAFNLLLNAPELRLDPENLGARVQLLVGSLFDPVAERTFDLIVSNPPFVITPRPADEDPAARYTYRDGGRRGDLLMEELISQLPRFLSDGGTAQLLGNWEIPEGADWDTRPRLWCEQLEGEAPVDAWFIQRDQQDADEYAETWLRDASTERDIAQYRLRYAAYLQDFDSRGVEAVGFGMIWMRRRSAADAAMMNPWRRFEEISGPVDQPLGPVIGGTVARAEAVARDAEAVLDSALVVAGDVTEERHQRFGAVHPEVIVARQGAGLRRSRPVSSAAAGLLGAADGEFAAAQLATAVASLMDDQPADGADLEQALRTETLELYVEGYLTRS
ncbi:DUF7059 domain-containing protein [Nesterenkonia halotolerans]|uniref:Methylase of polypeptide subunit release factors n=1 Tax=Nesterenkonia halotolerans TaxID=225325 RepID=A0ABR9J8C6_9MICC|nr:methyltransferase [Nesterenkonia halotolerans]MBE1515254.1 methylase of polypeptide subunit release factors [Nesterenkonia halotolerans]